MEWSGVTICPALLAADLLPAGPVSAPPDTLASRCASDIGDLTVVHLIIMGSWQAADKMVSLEQYFPEYGLPSTSQSMGSNPHVSESPSMLLKTHYFKVLLLIC